MLSRRGADLARARDGWHASDVRPLVLVPLTCEVLVGCGGGGGSVSATGTSTGAEDPTTGSGGSSGTKGAGSSSSGGTSSTSGSTAGSSSSGTPCACAPGEVLGCEGDQLSVCAEDCLGPAAQPCPGAGEVCEAGACAPPPVCVPGEVVCEGDALKTCAPDGGAFGEPVPCPGGQVCAAGECRDPCELAAEEPSSVGCSFFANRMDNYGNVGYDSLVVGNPSATLTATVQLLWTPNGGGAEQPSAPVKVAPGGTHTFALPNPPVAKVSALRAGGVYRVQSDVPLVAYQHSPLSAIATNDASMLLPEHALRRRHVVASYVGRPTYPSYFAVIAAADDTTVTWTPPIDTLAGMGVPAVAAGQTGQATLQRGDLLQVLAPPSGDVSGTLIDADGPIWVLGAVSCANVPAEIKYCDHLQEEMLPLDYWGKVYVGAHAPTRGGEKHHWRVFGGADGVTVSTAPPQPGTPFTLDKGAWKDLVVPGGTSLMFEGTGPFMPVQYLEGTEGGAGTGDPAMYQMIPVEQFLDRYAFVTGEDYDDDYVQVIRAQGGADVYVDGDLVAGYVAVGTFEVADWLIPPGAHFAESVQPFGVLQIGYTDVTSYAYPGGMRLAEINPQ